MVVKMAYINTYYCYKCKRYHHFYSRIGQVHWKFGPTTLGVKPVVKRGVSTGLFKSPRYAKYSQIVSFKSEDEARQSIKKLEQEFNTANTSEKELRVARVTQYAANRAFASANRKLITSYERQRLQAIGKIYRNSAKKSWELYRHNKGKMN